MLTLLNKANSEPFSSLQDYLVGHVRKIIKEEVSTVIQEQQATLSDSLISAMRSGAVTPVPIATSPADPQAQKMHILQLLRQGQLNTGFQQV